MDLEAEVIELKAALAENKRRTRRLSLSNVVLAVVVLAFGGATAAYALAPANSVNSASIIDRSIGTPDVKVGAFAGQTILDNSMTTKDIKDNSLTGADINEGTLVLPGAGTGAFTKSGVLTCNTPAPGEGAVACGQEISINMPSAGALSVETQKTDGSYHWNIDETLIDGQSQESFFLSAGTHTVSVLIGEGTACDAAPDDEECSPQVTVSASVLGIPATPQ